MSSLIRSRPPRAPWSDLDARGAWPWWGVASWVLTLGAVLASAALGGTIPAPDADPAVVAEWFETHRGSAAAAALVATLGVVPLLVFIAKLSSALSSALGRRGGTKAAPESGGPRLVLAVGCGAGVAAAAGAASLGLLAGTDAPISPVAAQVLAGLAFAFGGPLFAVMLGLTCLTVAATVRDLQVGPGALGAGGVVVGLAGLAAVASLVWPALLPLMPVGRFGGLGWLCATAFVLARFGQPVVGTAGEMS